MSRTSRFLGGLSYGYLNQALLMVTGLVLTPFLLSRLGQHDYGLWLVAAQLLNYLMLVDLGVVGLLPREAAYAVGRGGSPREAAELPSLIGRTARLVLWQLPVVALASFLIWWLLPEKWMELRGPLAWLLLAFFVVFPLRLFRAILQGVQDLKLLGQVQLGVWLASTATTVGLVLAGAGLYALVASWILNQILTALLLWVRLRRRWGFLLPKKTEKLEGRWARRYLASGGWMSVGQLSQALLNSTDMMIVGAVLNPAAVVPYACTAKLVQVMSNQPQMIMQQAVPALSELRYAETPERLVRVTSALTQTMLLISGLVAVVVLTINGGFVTWWVGPEQFSGLTLTALLLAMMLLRHWNVTAIFTLFSLGMERRLALIVLADGLVTVAASALLTLRFGLVGVPLGSMLAVCLVGLPLNLRAIGGHTGASLLTLLSPLFPWAWRFAILAAVAGSVAIYRPPVGFLQVAVWAAAITLFYGLLMRPVALAPPVGDYLRPVFTRLRSRFGGTPADDAGGPAQ